MKTIAKMKTEYNYSKMGFKRVNRMTVEGIENKFITEDMLLSPLYKKIKVDKMLKPYEFFPMNDLRVECYCKECNQRRIYSFDDNEIALCSIASMTNPGSLTDSYYQDGHNLEDELNRLDYFTFCAQADCKHNMIVLFKVLDKETIMKVGQYPSIYDLNEKINDKKFMKSLGKEYAEYYKKACSLYSFDTYIGALIYLRRIYEKILLDTFNANRDSLNISDDDFKIKRMDEKIQFLKKYLPSIMFQQGFDKIYTKISNGIHNLTEDECCEMFLILKMSIEEILIEKIQKEERNERIQALSKELQKS